MKDKWLSIAGIAVLGATFLVSASSIFIDPRSIQFTWFHLSVTLAATILALLDQRQIKNSTLVASNLACVLILAGWYYGFLSWPWKGAPAGRFIWERNTLYFSYSCLLFGWPLILLNHLRRRFRA